MKPVEMIIGNTKGGVKPGTDVHVQVVTADRNVLRKVLQTGLDEHIEYAKEFVKYTVTDAGVVAHFTDGTSVKGSFLIGADGARSPVRKQYASHVKPLDTCSRAIFGKTLLTPTLLDNISPAIIPDLAVVSDPSTSFNLLLQQTYWPQRNDHEPFSLPEDYLYWVLRAPKSFFPIPDTDFLRLNGTEAKALSLEVTKHWHHSIRVVLEEQDPQQVAVLRIVSMPLPIPEWNTDDAKGKVTLIGDAAHVMSPVTGSGTGVAFLDSRKLSGLLIKGGGKLSREDVRIFESEMRDYAAEGIKKGESMGGKFGQRPLAECEVADNL